jgi:hypothetical protein
MQLDRQTRHREQHRPRGKPNVAVLRRAELIRIYESRYGPVLPDDDSGLDDVQLYADHCGETDFEILRKFCTKRAPWMTAEEIAGVFVQRRRGPWSADDLAADLHLMDADRTRLGIRTIGAVDYSKAARTKRNKRTRRDRAHRSRSLAPPALLLVAHNSAAGAFLVAATSAFGGRLWQCISAGGWWLFQRAKSGGPGLLNAAVEAQASGEVHGPLMNPCH